MSTLSFFIKSFYKVFLVGFFVNALFFTNNLCGQESFGIYNIMLKDGWKYSNTKSDVSEHYLFEKDGMTVEIPKSPQNAPGGVNKFILDYANKLKGTDEFIEQQKQSIPVALYGKSQSARLTIKSKSTGARRFVYLTMADNKVYETFIGGNSINTDPAPEAMQFLSQVSVDKNANKTYADNSKYRTASGTTPTPTQSSTSGTPASSTPPVTVTTAVKSDADLWIDNMIKFLDRIGESSTAKKLKDDYYIHKKIGFGDTRSWQEWFWGEGGGEAETDGNEKITIKKEVVDFFYNPTNKNWKKNPRNKHYDGIKIEFAYTIIHEYVHVKQVKANGNIDHKPEYEDPAEEHVFDRLKALRDKMKSEIEGLRPDPKAKTKEIEDLRFILTHLDTHYITAKIVVFKDPTSTFVTGKKHLTKWQSLQNDFHDLVKLLDEIEKGTPSVISTEFFVINVPDEVGATELIDVEVFVPNDEKTKIIKYDWTPEPCVSDTDKNKPKTKIQFPKIDSIEIQTVSVTGTDISGNTIMSERIKNVRVLPVSFESMFLNIVKGTVNHGVWGIYIKGLFAEKTFEKDGSATVNITVDINWNEFRVINKDKIKEKLEGEKLKQQRGSVSEISFDGFEGYIYEKDLNDCWGSGYVDASNLNISTSGTGYATKGCLTIKIDYIVNGIGKMLGDDAGFCKREKVWRNDTDFLTEKVKDGQSKVRTLIEGIKLAKLQ